MWGVQIKVEPVTRRDLSKIVRFAEVVAGCSETPVQQGSMKVRQLPVSHSVRGPHRGVQAKRRKCAVFGFGELVNQTLLSKHNPSGHLGQVPVSFVEVGHQAQS